MKKLETYTDPQGQSVPAKYVKPYDRLRDQIARRIAREWQEEEQRLKALKARTLEAVEKLREAAAASVDVSPLGGKEGYMQFRSFDGAVTVRVDNTKRTEFDERLALAQALIGEAVSELCGADCDADLREIATKAFQPRRSGNLDMQRIRDLRSYNVKHPKWVKACEIISECERVIGYKRYIRVTVKPDRDAKESAICLDISGL